MDARKLRKPAARVAWDWSETDTAPEGSCPHHPSLSSQLSLHSQASGPSDRHVWEWSEAPDTSLQNVTPISSEGKGTSRAECCPFHWCHCGCPDSGPRDTREAGPLLGRDSSAWGRVADTGPLFLLPSPLRGLLFLGKQAWHNGCPYCREKLLGESFQEHQT